jgi:ABC-type dipeptide/oligopeptide/nickel transport system permease subunit
VLSLGARPFGAGARALGAGGLAILWRQILPNVMPPVVVLACVDLGCLLLVWAGLSFLGLGAQPPTPEWGGMLSDGRSYLLTAPQLMIYPGVAISLAVVGFNLVGEGLRDRLDPHQAVRPG